MQNGGTKDTGHRVGRGGWPKQVRGCADAWMEGRRAGEDDARGRAAYAGRTTDGDEEDREDEEDEEDDGNGHAQELAVREQGRTAAAGQKKKRPVSPARVQMNEYERGRSGLLASAMSGVVVVWRW